MQLSQIIKQLIYQVLESFSFSDIVIGTVISSNPIKIKINEKLVLCDFNLIFLKSCGSSFLKGTKVALIKQSDGQKYFVIDRILQSEEE